MPSSIAKKWITGVTGVVLVLFLVGHLAGNLLLFMGPEAFNRYAHFLEHGLLHGMGIYLAEAGLLAVVGAHAVMGILIWWRKKRVRPVAYRRSVSARRASRLTFASRTMLVSGVVVIFFLVWHIRMFKFGPAQEVSYDGQAMRDLYSVVITSFKEPLIVVGYLVSLAAIWLHLRHGIASAFQSLGQYSRRSAAWLYGGSMAAGVLLIAGFALLPLWACFFADASPDHAKVLP